MAAKNKGFGALPMWFMPSTKARPFKLEQRIDLAPAANPPSYGDDRFILFSYRVPKGQALVVQSMAFCLWQRINIGGPTTATYQRMNNAQVAGKVLFTPVVENQVTPFMENIQNPASTLALATNTPPLRSAGFTSISEDPETDLMANWFNPLFSFVVRSEQLLQVLFQILPVSSGNTLVLSDDPAVSNRIDFGGAYLAGQILADVDYSELVQEL